MVRRAIAILAILSFTVVAVMTAAHGTRMMVANGHAAPAHHMMATSGAGPELCGKTTPCGSDSCAAVCTGLPVYIAETPGAAADRPIAATYGLPIATALSGHSPDLNDRPPTDRLL